jgi:hypothetical protein
MGTAVEPNSHFVIGHDDVGRHIDEVTEDLARLGIVISTHAASHQTRLRVTVVKNWQSAMERTK